MTTRTTTARGRFPTSAVPRLWRAGLAAAGLFAGFAGLQVALAAGAPFGDHAWGRDGDAVLSASGRLASGAAAVVIICKASVVLARSGVIDFSPVPRRLFGAPPGRLRGCWRSTRGATWHRTAASSGGHSGRPPHS